MESIKQLAQTVVREGFMTEFAFMCSNCGWYPAEADDCWCQVCLDKETEYLRKRDEDDSVVNGLG